jgi:hypothetical protein
MLIRPGGLDRLTSIDAGQRHACRAACAALLGWGSGAQRRRIDDTETTPQAGGSRAFFATDPVDYPGPPVTFRRSIVWALAACVVAGCSKGATITPLTTRQTDPFCVDVTAFQAKAAALEAASTQGDLATVRTNVDAVNAALQALVTDAAKLPDKVNGHFVRDDLGVAAGTYSALKDALAGAKEGDPNALTTALASVENKEGQTFTSATGRLDAYTKKACNLVVSNPTTTLATTTTTGVVGPVGPTTSAAVTTTTAVSTTSTP